MPPAVDAHKAEIDLLIEFASGKKAFEQIRSDAAKFAYRPSVWKETFRFCIDPELLDTIAGRGFYVS